MFSFYKCIFQKMREKINEIRRAKAVNIEWDFVCDANAK